MWKICIIITALKTLPYYLQYVTDHVIETIVRSITYDGSRSYFSIFVVVFFQRVKKPFQTQAKFERSTLKLPYFILYLFILLLLTIFYLDSIHSCILFNIIFKIYTINLLHKNWKCIFVSKYLWYSLPQTIYTTMQSFV